MLCSIAGTAKRSLCHPNGRRRIDFESAFLEMMYGSSNYTGNPRWVSSWCVFVVFVYILEITYNLRVSPAMGLWGVTAGLRGEANVKFWSSHEDHALGEADETA